MTYHAPMRQTVAYGLGYGFGLGLARLGSAIAEIGRRILHR